MWYILFFIGVISFPGEAIALTLVEKADEAFKKRRYIHHASYALKQYETLYRKDSTNVEYAWRVAMVYQFVGSRLVKSPERKKLYFEKAITIGEKAILRDESCQPCYFWTAINMALYGNEVGKLKTLSSLKTIEKYLKKSAKLDPTYAYGGAYRILGIIEKELPGILGGSNKRAKNYFKKAIEIAPSSALNYSFLINFINEEEDNPKEIDALLAQANRLEKPSPLDIESYEAWHSIQRIKLKQSGR